MKRLEQVVRWVLNDAAYKAPEQIGDEARRWVEALREAVAELDSERTLRLGARKP